MPRLEDGQYVLDASEAEALLPDRSFIHTFRNPSGMMIGANWGRDVLLTALREAKQIVPTGEMASAIGHGIALLDDKGWLFVETAVLPTIPAE